VSAAAAAGAGAGERFAALGTLLAGDNGGFVELPILQPADVYIEIAGEEFRKRMFTVASAGGEELCLRPDFTIPVCLKHLADTGTDTGAARPRRADYAYLGPVFRQGRKSGAPEFLQAGVEWVDVGDAVASDADILALAVQAATVLGLAQTAIRVGDADLFAAVVAGLGLSETWGRKLVSAFGHAGRLERALARLAGGGGTATTLAQRLGQALANVGADDAKAIIEAVVDLPAIAPVGGRSGAEIAERILEQSAAAPPDRAAAAAETLARYVAIEAPLADAADNVAAFAADAGIALDTALARFRERTAAIAARGIDPAGVRFSAGFGRELDYYTGFVFELDDPARPDGGPVIGGGRYDRLFTLLGAARQVPAIGFAIWLDRFGIDAPGDRP
jgi:ATP phosphoribosyltransferase regulatory subunit